RVLPPPRRREIEKSRNRGRGQTQESTTAELHGMSPSSASTPPKSGRWSWVRIAPRESCFWNAFAPADGTCAARCNERDLGTSRLKGRLVGNLHHCDVFAEGCGDGFFGSPRNHRRLLATARAC